MNECSDDFLSARERYAAAAMTGLIALDCLEALSRIRELVDGAEPQPRDEENRFVRIARHSVEMADALIAEVRRKS